MPTLAEEYKNRDEQLIVKMLSLFQTVYPPVDWDTFKSQVLEERNIYNPHKRFGMIWFHIPSICTSLKELDYEDWKWVNKDNSLWNEFLTSKKVTINHVKNVMIRGIKELTLHNLIMKMGNENGANTAKR